MQNPITLCEVTSMDQPKKENEEVQQEQQEEVEEEVEEQEQQVPQQQINIVHVNFLAMFQCGCRRCERCMTRHG